MYEEYFELSGPPFKLNPDPKFFFGSRSHNKAMAYLHYGLKQAEGFIVITGPVGAGKSMVIGHLLDQLDRSNIVAAQLLTSNVGPDELLEHILSAFRIEPEGEGRTGQLEAFEDYLFDQLHRGRRVLLIMDEAQNLPHKTLEELRMLSNLDYDGTPLFQVFLVGQPEFRDTLTSEKMEQLKQRVIASYHLESLSSEETREYVQHRLSVVGWRQDPSFTDGAYDAIFIETGGRPRRINTLCNRLMLYCSLEKVHDVTKTVVKTVIAELHEEKLGSITAEPSAKKVSMPPVRPVVPKGDPVPDFTEEADAADAKIGEDVEILAQTADADIDSSSVFDRLRAKRAGDDEPDDDRQEATLTDVASAIAAASVADVQTIVDDVNIAEPMEGRVKDDAPDAATLLNTNTSGSWKKSTVRSLDEARDDLKHANAGIRRLRGAFEEGEKRQRARRAEITSGLSRADKLISELRRNRR
ncbi:MAG: XrtA/PEP-CTERM system-associated ATPase [Pseudomonadota bacterium]